MLKKTPALIGIEVSFLDLITDLQSTLSKLSRYVPLLQSFLVLDISVVGEGELVVEHRRVKHNLLLLQLAVQLVVKLLGVEKQHFPKFLDLESGIDICLFYITSKYNFIIDLLKDMHNNLSLNVEVEPFPPCPVLHVEAGLVLRLYEE